MYDPELSRLLEIAISQTSAELKQAAPFMARQVIPWLRYLAGTDRLQDYFTRPGAFPSLLLPWWLEKTLRPAPDLAFQSDLVRSTINGYYYIRLIDNLMDGHATVELGLLPVLGFFFTRVQLPYQRHFPYDHAFWDFFITQSSQSADVTIQDANLTDIDQFHFGQVSARKTCGVKIPLGAVCYKYAEPDLIAPWARFVDAFGAWHQMLNDLFDWPKDMKNGTPTYFLAEAHRRSRPHESVLHWVIEEGFDWAAELILTGMAESKALARELNSPALIAYLDRREALFLRQKEAVVAGLRQAARLLALLQQANPSEPA
jgi:hypothetical protein